MKCTYALIGFAVLFTFNLIGCKAKPDPGFVQREWATTFRELGIVPTFPPREDVVVGDIYAFDFDPNAPENNELFSKKLKDLKPDELRRRLSMGMTTRLMRIDLNSQISADYGKTISAPPTSPDFNSILGNPAQAAADAAVEKIATEIKGYTKQIDDEKKKIAAADDELLKAQQATAKAGQELTVAQAALTRRQAMFVDPKPFEDDLKAKKDAARLADKNYADALAAQTKANAGADQAKKDAATADVAEKNRLKTDASTALTQATDDLTAAKTQKVSTTAEVQAVDTAIAAQNKANADQLAKEQTKATELVAQTKLEGEVNPKVAAANTKLESAKVIQKAISDAGAKMLYPQPSYAGENLFESTPFDKEALDSHKSRLNRLRLVAFPDFSSVSVSAADLSALVPIDALSLGLNITSENVSQISVKIPAAESYGISVDDLLNAITSNTAMPNGAPASTLKSCYESAFRSAGAMYPPQYRRDGTLIRRILYFRVLTEVFYARAMDVGIFASKSFGGRLNVNNTPKAKSKDDSSNADQSTDAEATPLPAAKAFSTNPLVSELSDRLAANQTLPGGSVQILSKSETSIGIRRVFDRPVAVGFRALLLAVDPENKVILGISVDSSRTPSIVFQDK